MKVAIFLALALFATLTHGSAVPKKNDVEVGWFISFFHYLTKVGFIFVLKY